MKKIAIFASGSGSNAELTARYLRELGVGETVLILTNHPKAGVIERARELGISCEVFSREALKDGSVLSLLKEKEVDIILLLGFLLLMPQEIIEAYEGRIINQHPALLPKYGGRGMFGHHVHAAVAVASEAESGFTLHRVSPEYDEGAILFQARVDVSGDDADEVERKVRELEHQQAAPAIAQLIRDGQLG